MSQVLIYLHHGLGLLVAPHAHKLLQLRLLQELHERKPQTLLLILLVRVKQVASDFLVPRAEDVLLNTLDEEFCVRPEVVRHGLVVRVALLRLHVIERISERKGRDLQGLDLGLIENKRLVEKRGLAQHVHQLQARRTLHVILQVQIRSRDRVLFNRLHAHLHDILQYRNQQSCCALHSFVLRLVVLGRIRVTARRVNDRVYDRSQLI